ncbi:hypothetical protein HAY11_002712, partial [Salmonella enterica]|nr:hypothetical protein [Salmonella enterica]
MKNEHSELTKKFSSYNKKAIEALDTIDSTCLMKIIENSLLDNNNIIIYDIKKRLKRNDFFESLIEKISYEHCRNEIHRIYSISQGAEQLYDKIKTFIKSSDISKHAIDKQIWSHINRTESEFEYVYEELYTDIEKSMAMNDILTGIYINGTDGETVQADIAIEAYNHYLCMYLKMVAHENNFYDINGVLTLPQETMVNDTLIYEAGSILAASIAWFKLEEFSIKSLCFGGNYSRHLLQDFIKNDDIQSINSTEGIENKYVHYFQMKTTEYLLSDLISNARYFFKKYQNNIELSLENYDSDYILEKTGLNDIHEFSSLIFLQYTLFLENNIFTKEFGGLTLIEWIKGYSSLSTYAKNNISSPSLILSKNELIQLLNYRIE